MSDLSERLVESVSRASYVAAGGELPRMERHYQLHADYTWRPRARAAAAAALKELVVGTAGYPESISTDELISLVREIEAGR
jgi:hypothetical protein